MNTEKTKQKMRGKRLWWWDFNPENIYAFHEEEDIKLIQVKREKNAKRFPF